MSDTLPRYLYSDEDWDLWEERLMNCENDDDWLLVDRIEDAKKYLVNLIQKEAKVPSIKTQIKNRILQSMESYDPVGENYLKMVLNEMKKIDE